jgi:type II secretory pathway pseudopilin PulG
MKRRHNQAGFALLLVYVMAAAIAITMYIEVPRMAFESQRAKEQLAIDRGLQYERAIQLFYRKYHTYPQTLDDLETTRNVRFLRHRYLDPLTGKEWRLVHVGPMGQLTDSLVQPPPPLPGSSTGSGPNSGPGSSQNGSSPQAGNSPPATASSQPGDPNNPNDPNAQAPDPLNMALRRPSDRTIGAPGAGGAAGANAPVVEPEPPPEPPAEPPAEPDPNQPQQPQPAQTVTMAQPPDPADPNPPQEPTQPENPPQPAVPGQPVVPQIPGQIPSGQTPPTGANPVQTPTATPFTPVAGQPIGQPAGQPFPGQVPGQVGVAGAGSPPPQSAANLIQNILTTPRQPPSSTMGGFTSGNTGGIAGVASTAEGKGIHVINDHSKYKEWEFIYDLKKDKTAIGAAGVNQQQQIQQQMQPNQGGANSPFGSNSAFGGNSTFGSNNATGGTNSTSPFGSSPTASPTAPAAPTTPPPSQ